MTKGRKAQLFLSYAREDEEKVRELYQHLSDAGFKPWMDKEDIRIGEKWELTIEKAVRQSDFVLVCLSKKSFNKRGFLQKEIKFALDFCQEKLDSDIYLMPVRLEDCKVPDNLRGFQWADFFESDGLIRLINSIRSEIDGRAEEIKLVRDPINVEIPPTPRKSIDHLRKQTSQNDYKKQPSKQSGLHQGTYPYSELIGQAIDNYIIDDYLGAGGQAVVFLAHSRSFQYQVALKIFGLSSHSYPNIAFAMNEAKQQAMIDHSSVVKIYEPGITEIEVEGSNKTLLYLPMQYAPFGNCESDPPFADRLLSARDINTLISLLDGLNAIHEKDIIHNDIKPANILKFNERLGGQDHTVLRIADFGIARMLPHSVMGVSESPSAVSPSYMAPEQLDRKYSKKGDIYSMGAALFYMLTGQQPITQPLGSFDLLAWQFAHRTQPRPNAMDYNPYCPPRLALMVMQMMNPDPSSRPLLQDCIDILRSFVESLNSKALGFGLPNQLKSLLAPDVYEIRYVPEFRGIFKPQVHSLCGTSFFVIRIAMASPVFSQYRRLIKLLVSRFSVSFSMYETYGYYQVHIFLWSTADQIRTLKNEIERDYPGSAVEVNSVIHIDETSTGYSQVPDDLTLVGALAVQEAIDIPGLNPMVYLCDEQIDESPGRDIQALVYIDIVNRSIQSFARAAIIKSLRKRVLDLIDIKQAEFGDHSYEAVSSKHFSRIKIVEMTSDSESGIMVLDFVSSEYNYLHQLLTKVVDFNEYAVRASFFLRTGRIVIQSDKILF